MIERLYVHNYRCLENFTLDLKGKGSALLIGKNGSGKSTVRHALGVLQKIGRGPNRVKDWIDENDFAQHRIDLPMRFGLDVVLAGKRFVYSIAFEKKDHPEPIVMDETLTVEGEAVFARQGAEVSLPGPAVYQLQPGIATLPVIWGAGRDYPVERFRSFLASLVLVSPVPALMSGYAEGSTPNIEEDAWNFAAWLNDLLGLAPAAYVDIQTYVQSVIPDFHTFTRRGRNEKGSELLVGFKRPDTGTELLVEFGRLSDGEKCFFLSAAILAYAKHAGPVFCFWDEPDNHLSLPEIDHFITHLRKMANRGGQFVATSHHPHAIRSFADENTFVLRRPSHLEPPAIRTLEEIGYNGDLISALIRDEVL